MLAGVSQCAQGREWRIHRRPQVSRGCNIGMEEQDAECYPDSSKKSSRLWPARRTTLNSPSRSSRVPWTSVGPPSLAPTHAQPLRPHTVYKDLPHPPSGYLALASNPPPSGSPSTQNVKYAFRSADGSNYNVLEPNLGRAGLPYARSVPSVNCIPPQYLPDPGLVFDTLLKRDEFVEHPGECPQRNER